MNEMMLHRVLVPRICSEFSEWRFASVFRVAEFGLRWRWSKWLGKNLSMVSGGSTNCCQVNNWQDTGSWGRRFESGNARAGWSSSKNDWTARGI